MKRALLVAALVLLWTVPTPISADDPPKPPDDPDAIRAVHLFISGRVQGVGFRDFTKRAARELKLTGWVKNLPDRRVEALAEGPAPAIEKFLEAVRRGPQAARVEKVEIEERDPTGEFKNFAVRY